MLRKDENGFVLTGENVSKGLSKSEFYKEIKENRYEKVAQGLYASPDTWIDEEFLVQHRCPKAVFSHDSALYFHDLVDREPLQPTITIYTGYNPQRLKQAGVKVYTVKKELLDLGKCTVTNNMGNEIYMYNLERTICDLIRSRNSIEIQDFQSALKNYVKKSNKDLTKLMQYAKKFNIENILRKYMEILI